jgi:hypothetical protein
MDSKFTISTMVGIKNKNGETIKHKKVTLVNFHYVKREDCSKLFQSFALENDHINVNELTGEYFTQDFVNIKE